MSSNPDTNSIKPGCRLYTVAYLLCNDSLALWISKCRIISQMVSRIGRKSPATISNASKVENICLLDRVVVSGTIFSYNTVVGGNDRWNCEWYNATGYQDL